MKTDLYAGIVRLTMSSFKKAEIKEQGARIQPATIVELYFLFWFSFASFGAPGQAWLIL
jgi:hypothetical protein